MGVGEGGRQGGREREACRQGGREGGTTLDCTSALRPPQTGTVGGEGGREERGRLACRREGGRGEAGTQLVVVTMDCVHETTPAP
jgi:hypothetical protein